MAESVIPLLSSPPLKGERVSFTGTLASMTHRQAAGLVARNGGEASTHISKQTSMLVVGEEGWPLEEDGKPSVKLEQAHDAAAQGQPLRIIRESDWLRLLDLEQAGREVNRLHTPAMLQQLLGVSVSMVRRWERLGLIRAVQRVFRLPYFDYQQVASVRKLHELLQAGVSKQLIESSLGSLASVFPSLDEPLAQLEILTRDSVIAFRDRVGLVELRSLQRLMDFEAAELFENVKSNDQPTDEAEPSTIAFREPVEELKDQAHWSATDWFEHGAKLLERNSVGSAIEALRMAVMGRPEDPEMQFHLADALVRANNLAGALERYFMTVALDPEFVEAWTQLGCVHHLLGDADAAIDAFDIALATHRDYSVAVYHKAVVLFEQDKTEAARELFERYLEHESIGPWADDAREMLGLVAVSD